MYTLAYIACKETVKMVTKSKGKSADDTKQRTKIKKLNLNRDTVKVLSDSDIKKVKGGAIKRLGETIKTSNA